MVKQVVVLGVACWLGTTILVESEIFRPLRDWLYLRARRSYFAHKGAGVRHVLWSKADYFVNCHLCAGVWVAAALALVSHTEVATRGVAGYAVAALVIKGVGHFILEVVGALQSVGRAR